MANNVLIKPIVTEKSTKTSDKTSKYAFKVEKDANKLEIKKAIEATYNVKVESVNTQVNVGKKKSRQTKRGLAIGIRSPFKKAHVTLKAGETIDFYGSV